MTVFWKDFWEEIDRWIEDGEQLIIGGDWNSDVRKESNITNFRTRELIPANIKKHGIEGPQTYNGGTVPIDEIFTSQVIKVEKQAISNMV